MNKKNETKKNFISNENILFVTKSILEDLENHKKKQSVDLQMTVNIPTSNLKQTKKNFFTPISLPFNITKQRNICIIGNSLELEPKNIQNSLSTELNCDKDLLLSDEKTILNSLHLFDIVLTTNSYIERISSRLKKKLSTQGKMPNLQNNTLVSDEENLKKEYLSFKSGRKTFIKYNFKKKVTEITAQLGYFDKTKLEESNIQKNIEYVISWVEENISEVLELRKKQNIETVSLFISTTQGRSYKLV